MSLRRPILLSLALLAPGCRAPLPPDPGGLGALEALTGEFETALCYLPPSPGAEALTSRGRLEARWSADATRVEAQYRGDFLGLPPRFRSLIAYDRRRGCYVHGWTGPGGEPLLPLGEGHTWDDPARILFVHHRGWEGGWEGGGGVRMEHVLRILGPDEHVHEIYEQGEDGREVLRLRLRNRRR